MKNEESIEMKNRHAVMDVPSVSHADWEQKETKRTREARKLFSVMSRYAQLLSACLHEVISLRLPPPHDNHPTAYGYTTLNIKTSTASA